MFNFISLRYFMPALIWLFMIVGIIVSYYASRQIVFDEVVEQMTSQAHDHLNLFQGIFDHYIEAEETGLIHEVVSSLSSEPDLMYIGVIDKDNIILASSNYQEKGTAWSESESRLIHDEDRISSVVKNKSIDIYHDKYKQIINGYISLCPRISDRLRPQKCGFLIYQLDLAYHYAIVEGSIYRGFIFAVSVISVGGFLLLFILKSFITDRVNLLVSTLKSYSDGDRSVRSMLAGHDEIGWISDVINNLLDKVESARNEIEEREQQLETLFQTVIDAIIIIDDKAIIQRVNKAAEKLFGYDEQELIGRNIKILMPEPYKSEHDQYVDNYNVSHVKRAIGIKREVSAVNKNGHEFPVDISITEMVLGDRVMFSGIIRDITERKEFERSMRQINEELVNSNRRLNEFASKDGLTNLYNRRSFDNRIVEELNRATRDKTPMSVLMCDIDYFKLYNDTYGHQAGDECLYKVATVIKTFFQRGGEMVARYGGEEFVVILPAIDTERAHWLASMLVKTVQELSIEHKSSKAAQMVTISVGIGTYNPVGNIPPVVNHIIRAADEGLYKAKANGRNRVEIGGVIE